MTLTLSQIIGILSAGALLGMAGLMGLIGALTTRYDDEGGSCFVHLVALLAATTGLALLVMVFR